MRSLLILALLSACAPRYVPNNDEVAIQVLPAVAKCVSDCGMVVVNAQDQKDCERVNDWESAYVTAFARTGQNVCRAINDWKVILVDAENSVFVINHHAVAGATVCDGKMLFLATKPYGFKSALPHELGHVLDCTNGVPQADSHKHLGWDKNGYCEAIDASSTLHLLCPGGLE